MGHHAVVGPADFRSQEAILGQIRRSFPQSWCMTEERLTRRYPTLRPVTQRTLSRAMRDRVFVIDELDGSSANAAGHYEWCTSVACVEAMEHTAGAVCAPDIWRGVVFFAGGRTNGAASLRGHSVGSLQVVRAELRNAYVLLGPDLLIKEFSRLLNGTLQIVNRARTANISNSCALGMAMVAAGKAHLIIEPPQRPWDWAAGYRLITSAGGTVLFYRIDERGIYRVDAPTVADYNPSARALGFVAGAHPLVEQAFRLFEDSFRLQRGI